MAQHSSSGSHVVQVVQISVDGAGGPRVHRMVCARDPGHVVDPDTVEAQVESGIHSATVKTSRSLPLSGHGLCPA